MDMVRRGNRIELELDDEDSVGLHGVLSGQTNGLSADQIQRGQCIWGWIFEQVRVLDQMARSPNRKGKTRP